MVIFIPKMLAGIPAKPSGPGICFRKGFYYDHNVFNRYIGLFSLSILFTVDFDMLRFFDLFHFI